MSLAKRGTKSNDNGSRHDNSRPRVGQTVRLEVTGLGHGGEGVARHEGLAVFIPGAIPGERVTARLSEVRSSYARGALVVVDQAAPERVLPACPIYDECGGCQLQHISYDQQLALKTQQVKDALQRIGHLDPGLVKPALGARNPWNYRNKAQFPVGLLMGEGGESHLAAGLFARGTHRVVDADSCMIQSEVNNRILSAAKAAVRRYGYSPYDERTGEGLVRHILARTGTRSGQAMAVLVTAERRLPRAREFAAELMEAVPGLTTVVQNVNPRRTNVILGDENITLAGPGYIEDELMGLSFRISPVSFFQVNPEQTEVLYTKALEFAGLTGSETVLDGYCGIGTISLFMARKAGRVIGIEEVSAAIRDARENAERNHISNAEFRVGTVEELAPKLLQEGVRPDLVVVDPPRKGVEASALDAFVEMAPLRIVYVSCNPATLARDLAYLTERGYRGLEVQPVDMFPHTSHVETCCLLYK